MCPVIDISTTTNCIFAVAENPLIEPSIPGFEETLDWRVELGVTRDARGESIGRPSDQEVARTVLAFRRSILIRWTHPTSRRQVRSHSERDRDGEKRIEGGHRNRRSSARRGVEPRRAVRPHSLGILSETRLGFLPRRGDEKPVGIRFRSRSRSSDQHRHDVPRMTISESPRSSGVGISWVDS